MKSFTYLNLIPTKFHGHSNFYSYFTGSWTFYIRCFMKNWQTWVSGCHQVYAADDPSWDPKGHDGHIRGTCPFICHSETVGKRVQTWQRQRWRWTKVREAIDSNNSIKHWSPAPSDFHLFPNLKKDLAGQRYTTDEEVTDAVDSYLEDQPKDFYSSGIEALRHRWKKCVDSQGGLCRKNRALKYFCLLPSLGGS